MRADLDRAREALRAIPPDLPRDEWVRAGMAAHAAGLPFDEFDAWSAGGGNYDARAARDTWRSFKDGKGIGPGTLFKMAAQAGWSPGDKRERAIHAKALGRPVERTKAPRPGMGAAEVWQRCEPAAASHAYIEAKQGTAEGLRVVPEGDPLRVNGERMAGCLVVPVVPLAGGEPVSLQFIAPPELKAEWKARKKSDKPNLPNHDMAGVFIVGELLAGGTAYLCEGIGTAWACWKATGASAVVCFGWGNVRNVAAEMRQRDPSAQLVLVPDVGKEAEAERIAREARAEFVTMPAGSPNNFDANDYGMAEGFDALEELLHGARKPEPPPLPFARAIR